MHVAGIIIFVNILIYWIILFLFILISYNIFLNIYLFKLNQQPNIHEPWATTMKILSIWTYSLGTSLLIISSSRANLPKNSMIRFLVLSNHCSRSSAKVLKIWILLTKLRGCSRRKLIVWNISSNLRIWGRLRLHRVRRNYPGHWNQQR